MSAKVSKTLTIIKRLEDIPVFQDETEEHAFWAEHEFSDELWESAEPVASDEAPPFRLASGPITIQFDE